MRRTLALLAALLLALGLAACGDDDDDATSTADDSTTTTAAAAEETTTTMAEPAGEATVATVQSALGPILVDGSGMTLYLFKPDTLEESKCTDDCTGAWPPLMLDGEPVAGDGVDQALLTTAPRSDGDPQVVYDGHRLYRFSGDAAAGETNGQGVADVWYAVTPAGEAVTG